MRVITVVWEDLLAAKMFIRFWKDNFAPTVKIESVPLSCLLSKDVNVATFKKACELTPNLLVFTYQVKKNTPNESLPVEVVEGSSIVLRLDRECTMTPIKLQESDSTLTALWKAHIDKLGAM